MVDENTLEIDAFGLNLRTTSYAEKVKFPYAVIFTIYTRHQSEASNEFREYYLRADDNKIFISRRDIAPNIKQYEVYLSNEENLRAFFNKSPISDYNLNYEGKIVTSQEVLDYFEEKLIGKGR